MKKGLMSVAVLLGATGFVSAQKRLQVGMNLGPTVGVSVKYMVEGTQGVEGIFGYNTIHEGPSFKFIYEYGIPLVDDLMLNVGGGAHLGVYHVNRHHGGSDFAVGLVPSIGLEYAFRNAPLNFGFSYQPAINFTSCTTWDDFAFKLRYRF